MPFPWYTHAIGKTQKVHFLACDYHLTGNRRAKATMDEVIDASKAAARHDPQTRPEFRRGWGRELYNMCTFWANAYEETGDPELKALGAEWLDLALKREYSPELKEFRTPPIYLYNGLILQQRLLKSDRARDVMLQNLAHHGYPGLQDGGVWDVEKAIACGWAYEQTRDEGFVRTAWDVARALADLVPDHDWRWAGVPPYPYSGNQLGRHLLMPILVGTALAAKHDLPMNAPFVRRDTFVSLDAVSKDKAAGEVRLRPRSDGDLPVRVLLVTASGQPAPPVTVTAFDAGGTQVGRATLTMKQAEMTPERHFDPHWWCAECTLTLPAARRGTTYTLRLDGDAGNGPMVLVLADAQIVHRVTPGRYVDFFQEAGQYFAGARVFGRTDA